MSLIVRVDGPGDTGNSVHGTNMCGLMRITYRILLTKTACELLTFKVNNHNYLGVKESAKTLNEAC